MTKNGSVAEVIGLDGLLVTKHAIKLVKAAGYSLRVTYLLKSDLPYIHYQYGNIRLPAVRLHDRTLQGMKQIREFLSK